MIRKKKGKINEENAEKLRRMYTRYESKMYAVAYAILHQTEQAEDVVQDAFVKLTDYLDDIEDVDGYRTQKLIFKIVKTTAINKYHKNQSEAYLAGNVTEETIEGLLLKNKNNHSNASAEELAILNDSVRQVIEAGRQIPVRYRKVLVLRLYYDCSFQEIAEIMGIGVATARKRYQRGRDIICKKLEEEGGSRYEGRELKRQESV